MEDDFFAMPQLTLQALHRRQQSLTPQGRGCLHLGVSPCRGSSFLVSPPLHYENEKQL